MTCYLLSNISLVVTTWHFGVTSSATWSFDSPQAISYWRSFGTASLSPAVFEILGSKYIGITTLTYQGHVTSSVMWPFDSPWVISYGSPLDQDSISNGFRDTQWRMWRNVWHDLDMPYTTSKQTSRSFILVPFNFSYTTYYSNFCSRTHRWATMHNATDDDRRNSVAQARLSILSANNKKPSCCKDSGPYCLTIDYLVCRTRESTQIAMVRYSVTVIWFWTINK